LLVEETARLNRRLSVELREGEVRLAF
jgi:hypothetical protein